MRLILSSLLLVSSVCNATAVENIKVFHTNKVPVVHDVPLNGTQRVEVFNMDTKNNGTSELNKLLQAKRSSIVTQDGPMVAYRQAFDEILNGSQWDGIYAELEKGSLAIEKAIRYKVEKTPAIIINDTAVIYGVTSLREAIQIYNQEQRK